MIRKILTWFFMVILAAGCARCVLMRSEYYDITGSVIEPKQSDAVIEIYTVDQKLERPYTQIGAIKVMARYGTSRKALDNELIKRAQGAGADAVIDVEYVEDKENDLTLCGKLFATKRNTVARGTAVVFGAPVGQE